MFSTKHILLIRGLVQATHIKGVIVVTITTNVGINISIFFNFLSIELARN